MPECTPDKDEKKLLSKILAYSLKQFYILQIMQTNSTTHFPELFTLYLNKNNS